MDHRVSQYQRHTFGNHGFESCFAVGLAALPWIELEVELIIVISRA